MDPSPLLPAPRQLVHERGIPAFGMYQGVIPHLNWHRLPLSPLARLTRKLHHKRWQYAALAHDACFAGIAVVDLGWSSAAFAWLFDRQAGREIAAFSATGLPGGARLDDTAFGHAAFRSRAGRIAFSRDGDGDRVGVEVDSRTLKLAAHLLLDDTPVLAAVAPANYLAHATHKSGGLEVVGFADATGQRFSLNGAVGSLDASNGLLARRTEWRWASAHDRGLGFNLQSGYMGDAENAVWLDGRLVRVGAAHFDYDPADPAAPWRIKSDDGVVDLVFTPEGLRREDRDLVIAASRYVQPIGTFSGVLRDPASGACRVVDRLCGVTEDHHSRW